jgi:hypothetical protein
MTGRFVALWALIMVWVWQFNSTASHALPLSIEKIDQLNDRIREVWALERRGEIVQINFLELSETNQILGFEVEKLFGSTTNLDSSNFVASHTLSLERVGGVSRLKIETQDFLRSAEEQDRVFQRQQTFWTDCVTKLQALAAPHEVHVELEDFGTAIRATAHAQSAPEYRFVFEYEKASRFGRPTNRRALFTSLPVDVAPYQEAVSRGLRELIAGDRNPYLFNNHFRRPSTEGSEKILSAVAPLCGNLW